MNVTEQRNEDICLDYETKDINELARTYGLSSKRIKQILDEKNIERRPLTGGERRIISAPHSKIGLHLFNFRKGRELSPHQAASEIGWSMIKLRRIEQGLQEIELLDLLVLLQYTKTNLVHILENKHG